MKQKKLWFRRKLYGWGWFPITIEGWLATFAYILVLVFLFKNVDLTISTQHSFYVLTVPVIVLTTLFIALCFYKGERPRWQWGKRTEDISE